MDEVNTPFVINIFYFCDSDGKTEYVWSKEKLPVNEKTPHLTAFCFKNIQCNNVKTAACYIYGLPEKPIDEEVFENVTVTYTDSEEKGFPAMMSHIEPVNKKGFFLRNVNSIQFKNISIEGQNGSAYDLDQYQNLQMDE